MHMPADPSMLSGPVKLAVAILTGRQEEHCQRKRDFRAGFDALAFARRSPLPAGCRLLALSA